MGVTKDIKNKIREWEYKNLVYGTGYVDKTKSTGGIINNMARRGYDAMRISPSITTKWGLKYRAVYGASVSPNYSLSKRGEKYYPKVEWYKQGYVKAGKLRGSFKLHSLSDFKREPLNSLLMIRKKR